jgi:hypothetical protein
VGHGRDCRRTGAGSRRLRWSDAALPDQDAHAVRRFDDREFHVRALRKVPVRRERRTQAVEPFLIWQRRHELHTLRVADREGGDGQHFAANIQRLLAQALGLAHGGAKGVSRSLPADQRQDFPTGIGIDAHLPQRRQVGRFALMQDESGQAAQPIA